MKFGEVSVEKALGAMLGHSLKVGGTTLKKGQKLTKKTLAFLQQNHVTRVTVARLAKEDIEENQAASELARAVAGRHARQAKSLAGRAAIYGRKSGILLIKKPAIDAINNLGQAIAIATLPPYSRVQQGQMLANIKILPLALAKKYHHAALKLAKTPPICIRPFLPRKTALVITQNDKLTPKVQQKCVAITRARLQNYKSPLTTITTAAHETDSLKHALMTPDVKKCQLILIFGASAIMDRQDVIPRALRQVGGRVVHFGMPVDPGNLLLLGKWKIVMSLDCRAAHCRLNLMALI